MERLIQAIKEVQGLANYTVHESLEYLFYLRLLYEKDKKSINKLLGVIPEEIPEDILRTIEEIKINDIIKFYSWELAKYVKKFETEELFLKESWESAFNILERHRIKNVIAYVDSPIIAYIIKNSSKNVLGIKFLKNKICFLPVFNRVMSTIFEKEPNSRERPDAILISIVKANKDALNELIAMIRYLKEDLPIVVFSSKKFFLSRGGLLTNLKISEGVFLSINFSSFIGRKLLIGAISKERAYKEPFQVGKKLGVVRYGSVLVFNPKIVSNIENILGLNPYPVYEGIITGRDDAYLVITLEDKPDLGLAYVCTIGKKTLGFRNCGFVEKDVLYPVARFSDIRWPKTIPEYSIVLPLSKDGKIIDEGTLKGSCPNAYDFLVRVREVLVSRRVGYYKAMIKDVPFYYVHVNKGIMAPYKIVWKGLSKEFNPSLLEPQNGKPVVVLSGTQYIPAYTREEALYIFGILNSETIREIVSGNEYNTKISIRLIKSLKIPKYNKRNSDHKKLVLEASKLIKYWDEKGKVRKEALSEINKLSNRIIDEQR